MSRLVTLGAMAGMAGGALRIIAAFIAFAPGLAWLETLYGVIDIGLMFGLIAVYLATADDTGGMGLAGFAVALIGLASIIGPDGHAFGVDFYVIGSSLLLLGLSVLGIQLLRSGVLVAASGLWLVAAGAGMVFAGTGSGGAVVVAGVVAGVALGLGFLVACVSVRRRGRETARCESPA